jgi:hypothetical protein
VAVSGNYAYLVNSGDHWPHQTSADLLIIDISNPSAPNLAGSYMAPGMTTSDVAVSGNFAYVAAFGDGLHIVDVSDPANIRPVGWYDTPSSATGVTVFGEYIYVADTSGGLQILKGYSSDPSVVAFPGDIDNGQTYPFSIKFKVPQGVDFFRTSFTGSAEDVCGNSYTYGG